MTQRNFLGITAEQRARVKLLMLLYLCKPLLPRRMCEHQSLVCILFSHRMLRQRTRIIILGYYVKQILTRGHISYTYALGDSGTGKLMLSSLHSVSKRGSNRSGVWVTYLQFTQAISYLGNGPLFDFFFGQWGKIKRNWLWDKLRSLPITSSVSSFFSVGIIRAKAFYCIFPDDENHVVN